MRRWKVNRPLTSIPTNRVDLTTKVPIPKRMDEPRVELLRDGEVVKTIRVTCGCGTVVDIDCQYSESN